SRLSHSASFEVVTSPSWAAKQNRQPRCSGPPSAGPRQRRRLHGGNLAMSPHFCRRQRDQTTTARLPFEDTPGAFVSQLGLEGEAHLRAHPRARQILIMRL